MPIFNFLLHASGFYLLLHGQPSQNVFEMTLKSMDFAHITSCYHVRVFMSADFLLSHTCVLRMTDCYFVVVTKCWAQKHRFLHFTLKRKHAFAVVTKRTFSQGSLQPCEKLKCTFIASIEMTAFFHPFGAVLTSGMPFSPLLKQVSKQLKHFS